MNKKELHMSFVSHHVECRTRKNKNTNTVLEA